MKLDEDPGWPGIEAWIAPKTHISKIRALLARKRERESLEKMKLEKMKQLKRKNGKKKTATALKKNNCRGRAKESVAKVPKVRKPVSVPAVPIKKSVMKKPSSGSQQLQRSMNDFVIRRTVLPGGS